MRSIGGGYRINARTQASYILSGACKAVWSCPLISERGSSALHREGDGSTGATSSGRRDRTHAGVASTRARARVAYW